MASPSPCSIPAGTPRKQKDLEQGNPNPMERWHRWRLPFPNYSRICSTDNSSFLPKFQPGSELLPSSPRNVKCFTKSAEEFGKATRISPLSTIPFGSHGTCSKPQRVQSSWSSFASHGPLWAPVPGLQTGMGMRKTRGEKWLTGNGERMAKISPRCSWRCPRNS